TAAMPHKDVSSLTFTPNGKTLAAGDAQGNLKLWSIQFGRVSQTFTVPGAHKGGPVWALVFSPDGKTLYSAGADKTIKVWDAGPMPPKLKTTLAGHEDRVRGLAISRDGRRLASTSDRDNTIRLWDLSDKPKEEAKLAVKGARSVSFSPDGQTLAAG